MNGARRKLVLESLEQRAMMDGTALYRVNAGGPQVNSSPNWLADTDAIPSIYSNFATSSTFTERVSQSIDLSDPSIPVGTPAELFQTERWDEPILDDMKWDFPVTPGNYQVRLYFAETYSQNQEAGKRIFDVAIENKLVLDDFDIYSEVGGFKGIVKTFTIASDSNIDIDFTREVEHCTVQAIEIIPVTAPPVATNYRINAGGSVIAATPNWVADTASAPSIYSNVVAANSLTESVTRSIDLTHPSIPAGTPQELFQTERWDEDVAAEMQWNFPVAPGNYEVLLYFSETYSENQAINKRVFDVSIENTLVLDNFDIFKEVGGYRGLVKKFTITADSNIDIDFARMIENPTINAIEIRPTVIVPPTVTNYRVNAGGSVVTTTPNWIADTASAPSIFSNVITADSRTESVTRSIDLTHPSIPVGTPQELFQTERWDADLAAEMQWNFPVTPGNYEVLLYFAETYSENQAIGKRVFDVSIENTLVLDDFDIFKEVGGYKGVVKKFTINADSNIDIDFNHLIENPTINAIEIRPAVIVPPTVTNYRVNAGGSVVTATPNWIADTASAPSIYSNVITADSRTESVARSIDLTHPSIPVGTPQDLFQTERWDENVGAEMQWNFPVTPGNYEVLLYFSETYSENQAINKRVFDVSIENTLVLDNFDIFKEVGGYKGLVKKFTINADSNIDIDFARLIENPTINAIEIRSLGSGTSNQAPVINPIVDKTVIARTSIAIDVKATDPNENAMRLSASNLPSFVTFVDNGDGTGAFAVASNPVDIGTYTISLSATDNALPPLSSTTSFSLVVKPDAIGQEKVVYRVNAGGPEITSSPNWTTDAPDSPSPYSNASATLKADFFDSVIDLTDPSIPQGTPHSIFQTVRFDPLPIPEMHWEFPVSPGSYIVRLYFAEPVARNQRVGARVFDVLIENNLVLNDYDIFADVGVRAVAKSFLVNADSAINIDFSRVVENPAIYGIEILTPSTLPGILGASASSLEFVPTPNGSIAQQTLTLTNLGSLGSPPIVIDATSIQGATCPRFPLCQRDNPR